MTRTRSPTSNALLLILDAPLCREYTTYACSTTDLLSCSLSMDAISINSMILIGLYNNAIPFAKSKDRLNDGIELWVQFSLRHATIDWLVYLLIVVGRVTFSFFMCRLDHKMPALLAFLYWQVSGNKHCAFELCMRDIQFRLTLILMLQSIATILIINLR